MVLSQIRIKQGNLAKVLEASNVNTIEELVRNIDMQRQFEINVKLIKKASDLDSASTKLMNLPT